MKIYKNVAPILLTLIVGNLSFGQEKTNFSLLEAEEYGVNNNEKVKNSMLDTEIARKKVWETLAIGLPQISAEGQFQQLLDIPVSVVDAKLFNPSAADGELLEFRMGQEFSSSLAFNATQLIFDGSYIVGIQFTKFFEKMASTQADNSKQQVKAMVREAYYNVLVANENLVLMDSILLSTKSLWEKMKIFASSGLIKQEEADQVEIAYNRIRVSKASGERQANVALNLLKLQMGYPFDQPLTLTQTLSDILTEINGNNPLLAATSVKENQNFILMEQQKELDGYALRNQKAAYIPSVGAFFTHSQNAFRNEFDFFEDKPWYPTTILGVSVRIPITSSGQKLMRVQQAEIKIEQDQNNLDNLEKTLQFQELQLKTSYESALEMMELEQSNVALARKIYANAIIRNQTGVISALEVTQLQSQLLTAEGNYIMTIMEMLKIKVQLDNLYNK
jgi:outer membrane protein TolC